MFKIQETVINGGYCIGCGACTAVENSPFKTAFDENGCIQAFSSDSCVSNLLDESISDVCPFYNSESNENVLSRELFRATNEFDSRIGYYHQTFCGRVGEGDFFAKGSSGGMGKWLLTDLLERNMVDYVIQVVSNGRDPDQLFQFKVISDSKEVINGAKSGYYPVEMSSVLKFIKQNPGRYAITGVPCFIKSIRLLQKQQVIFKERIKYCVGIVCGHLKSRFYADMIGWQVGIPPGNVSNIDFRVKMEGEKANQKAVKVTSVDGTIAGPFRVNDLFGVNYGYGFFSYKACEFCDDVIAETADISFGDAWLPRFIVEGTSIIISRNPELSMLIEEGKKEGRIILSSVSPHEVYQSQEAGFRHRREGLAVRINEKRKAGKWVPRKRFETIVSSFIRILIYRKRTRMGEKSFRVYLDALAGHDFRAFKKKISREIMGYKFLYALEGLIKKVTGKKRKPAGKM
ncbi:MAG: Coenzyme F420 hydrogenase/dehydrogenase, beta subunit C-terminal domain [Bacteroidota bacterium]